MFRTKKQYKHYLNVCQNLVDLYYTLQVELDGKALNFYIQLSKKDIKGHTGGKTRKNATASSESFCFSFFSVSQKYPKISNNTFQRLIRNL